MNTAAAIEIAVAAVLRQFATLGEGVVVRPWQSLASDPTWKASKDRSFPMVSVQCTAPATEDGNPAIQIATCRVICGTWNDDDQDHSQVRAMYEEAEWVLMELFGAFRTGNESAEVYAAFKANLEANANAATFADWALRWEGGDAPMSGNGANFMGVSIVVHFRNPAFC